MAWLWLINGNPLFGNVAPLACYIFFGGRDTDNINSCTLTHVLWEKGKWIISKAFYFSGTWVIIPQRGDFPHSRFQRHSWVRWAHKMAEFEGEQNGHWHADLIKAIFLFYGNTVSVTSTKKHLGNIYWEYSMGAIECSFSVLYCPHIEDGDGNLSVLAEILSDCRQNVVKLTTAV